MRHLGLGLGKGGRFGAETRERGDSCLDLSGVKDLGLRPRRGKRFRTGTTEMWEIWVWDQGEVGNLRL